MTANIKTTGFQAESGIPRNHHPDSGNDRQSQVQSARVAGLCSTCIHAPGCTLNTYPREPVLYCEEFDSRLTMVGESETGAVKSPTTGKPASDTARQTEGRLGLCLNCVHQETCKLPRSGDGVWYCEEYE